jgi:hypothetical protein
MDHGTFDALTRSLAGGVPPRRAALRLLTGGALGALLARLGLDDVEAKKRRGKKHDNKKQSDKLHTTGKKHKKHKKHKDKKKPYEPPPPLPPGCQNCGDCEMCQDGACVPDPDLERVFCAVSEAMCSYCQQGTCTPFQEACDDGTCPRKGYCCQGEKFCPSIESPTGFFCIRGDGCCAGKKKCGNQCIPLLSCCDEDPDPECDQCQEEFCDSGTRACRDKSTKPTCSSTERYDCDTGQCVCREGWETCGELFRCNCYVGDGVRQCLGGTCCPPSLYCAASSECCHGGLVCTPEGCCPINWIVNGHCVWYS